MGVINSCTCPAKCPATTCCHVRSLLCQLPCSRRHIRLVEALAQDLPIFFDHVVSGIDYSEAGVAVHTAKQTFTGASLEHAKDSSETGQLP